MSNSPLDAFEYPTHTSDCCTISNIAFNTDHPEKDECVAAKQNGSSLLNNKKHVVTESTMNSNEIEMSPYNKLCSCEEDGKSCACKSHDIPNTRLQLWNRWKSIAMGIVIALVVVWLIVYVGLSQKKVI